MSTIEVPAVKFTTHDGYVIEAPAYREPSPISEATREYRKRCEKCEDCGTSLIDIYSGTCFLCSWCDIERRTKALHLSMIEDRAEREATPEEYAHFAKLRDDFMARTAPTPEAQ